MKSANQIPISMAQGGHPATPTAPTGPLGPQSPHHHHPGFPVAAPRVSRSKMPMAAPVRHHLPGHNGPQGSPVKFNPHMFHPNLSGSETDVSTSTENLTQEERFLLRHMEREEPQGEETGDALASFAHLQRSAGGLSAADISAIISHRQQQLASSAPRLGTPTANPTYVNAQEARNLQDEMWAAKIAAVSRGAGSPLVSSVVGMAGAPTPNPKLNPSVYSQPGITDPLLNPAKGYPLSVLKGKRANVDVTSSGAFFDPKAVTRTTKDMPRVTEASMISQLTKEMRLQQLSDESLPKSMQNLFSGSSELSNAGSNPSLNKTSTASDQTLTTSAPGPRTVSTGSSSGYRSDNSTGSLVEPSPNTTSLKLPKSQEGSKVSKKVSDKQAALSRSQPDLFAAINESGGKSHHHAKGLELNLSGVNNSNYVQVLETLQNENRELRRELEELARRNAKVTMVEEEMSKIQDAYQNLLKHSEKREALEKAARQKLQNVIINLTEVNKEVTERHEAVMGQLMSGDQKNQNIPGLDAILRGEIMRKDALIMQLMNQNKMLLTTKERQDIEMIAQQETLEEQRAHIQILDSALSHSQAQLLRLEEENRIKEGYAERIKQMTRSLEQLQAASEKREAMEKKLRAKLEEELREFRESAIHGRQGSGSSENVSDLKRKVNEAEEKLIRLESERIEWEQRYLEEAAMRQVAIDAASIPKDAKIAALEKNSAESEKIIAEARSDKMKQFEEMQHSHRKMVEMENHIKTLETNLAEHMAMVRILQSNQATSAASSTAALLQQQSHQQHHLLTHPHGNPALSHLLHARQLSHLGTPTSAAHAQLIMHAKQLSSPVTLRTTLTSMGQRSPGLAVNQTDLLKSAMAGGPESAPSDTLRAAALTDGHLRPRPHQHLHLTTSRDLLRSATPTADLMRSMTPVSLELTGAAAGRRDSAPGDVLAHSIRRNRNASGSTLINASDFYASTSGTSTMPKMSIASLRDSKINKSTSKYSGNPPSNILDDSIGSIMGPMSSTQIGHHPEVVRTSDGSQPTTEGPFMEVWRI